MPAVSYSDIHDLSVTPVDNGGVRVSCGNTVLEGIVTNVNIDQRAEAQPEYVIGQHTPVAYHGMEMAIECRIEIRGDLVQGQGDSTSPQIITQAFEGLVIEPNPDGSVKLTYGGDVVIGIVESVNVSAHTNHVGYGGIGPVAKGSTEAVCNIEIKHGFRPMASSAVSKNTSFSSTAKPKVRVNNSLEKQRAIVALRDLPRRRIRFPVGVKKNE